MKFSQEFNEMQENTVKPSWILNAGNHINNNLIISNNFILEYEQL